MHTDTTILVLIAKRSNGELMAGCHSIVHDQGMEEYQLVYKIAKKLVNEQVYDRRCGQSNLDSSDGGGGEATARIADDLERAELQPQKGRR